MSFRTTSPSTYKSRASCGMLLASSSSSSLLSGTFKLYRNTSNISVFFNRYRNKASFLATVSATFKSHQPHFATSAMSGSNILIYLLRRDLRVSDNPILHAFSTREDHGFTHLLPLYVFPAQQLEAMGFIPRSRARRVRIQRRVVRSEDSRDADHIARSSSLRVFGM